MARLLDALMHPVSQLVLLISIVALSGLYLFLPTARPVRPTHSPITPIAGGMMMPAGTTTAKLTPTPAAALTGQSPTITRPIEQRESTPVATTRPRSAIPTMANGPICACSRDSYSCAELGEQAQGCFDYCFAQGQGDVHRLDYNGNGVACEE